MFTFTLHITLMPGWGDAVLDDALADADACTSGDISGALLDGESVGLGVLISAEPRFWPRLFKTYFSIVGVRGNVVSRDPLLLELGGVTTILPGKLASL